MKKRTRILAVGVCMALCLLLVSSAMAETIQLKASTFFPMKHRLVVDAYNILDKEITKRTKGRVKINWYHTSTLVKAGKAYDALRSGMADLALIPVAALPQYFPVTVGYGLPFMSESAKHSVEIGLEMYRQIPEMKKEWSKVKLLGIVSSDVNNLAFREKRVKKLEDLKGLRVGVAWATTLRILKLLPCAAMQLTPEDTYISVQRGTVDGVMIPFAAIRTWKIADLTKYHTICNIAVMPVAWAMSKKTYQKLPPDLKKVFDDISPSFARLFGLTSHNEGEWVEKALKQRGDTFDYLSKAEVARWKKPLQPLYDQYIKSLNDRGMDGQAIFKKVQAISDYTRKHPYPKIDEWWKQGKMGMK